MSHMNIHTEELAKDQSLKSHLSKNSKELKIEETNFVKFTCALAFHNCFSKIYLLFESKISSPNLHWSANYG